MANGQLIPGLDKMPSFIAAPILSGVKDQIAAVAPDLALTDEALTTILSSEQTLGYFHPNLG